jgi:hypothetical protein
VNLALASVRGVDLNPYAVAIVRFRLLVAASTPGPSVAAELKEFLDEVADQTRRHEGTKGRLGEIAASIGITSFTLEDDVFLLPTEAARRHSIPALTLRPMIVVLPTT